MDQEKEYQATVEQTQTLPLLILSEQELENLGLSADPKAVVQDVKTALIRHGMGRTISDKVALTPSRDRMFTVWNADDRMKDRQINPTKTLQALIITQPPFLLVYFSTFPTPGLQ